MLYLCRLRPNLLCHFCQGEGADKQFGATILQDVDRFLFLQMGADGSKHQARALGGPDNFHELAVVFHHQADMVAGL